MVVKISALYWLVASSTHRTETCKLI